MKKYKFLFKPIFFIFSLLFASWMVLTIEKIKPSDFGKYESLFKSKTNTPKETGGFHEKEDAQRNRLQKKHIKKLCSDYKAGVIDSIKLNEQLEQIFKMP